MSFRIVFITSLSNGNHFTTCSIPRSVTLEQFSISNCNNFLQFFPNAIRLVSPILDPVADKHRNCGHKAVKFNKRFICYFSAIRNINIS